MLPISVAQTAEVMAGLLNRAPSAVCWPTANDEIEARKERQTWTLKQDQRREIL